MASFVICNSAYHGSALLELSAPDPLAARERAPVQSMSPSPTSRHSATSACLSCLAPPNHSRPLAMSSN